MKRSIFMSLCCLACWAVCLSAGYAYGTRLYLDAPSDEVLAGQQITFRIMADSGQNIGGVVCTLVFPADSLEPVEGGISSDLFQLDTSNGIIPMWSATYIEPGRIGLSGFVFPDPARIGTTCLFSITFKVKPDAAFGDNFISLEESVICDQEAGWGGDQDGDGLCEKQEGETVPVLFGVDQSEVLEDNSIVRSTKTYVLLDRFNEPVTDFFTVDGCPEDPDKTDPGVCGCNVPDIDSDQDGVADCIDVLASPANGAADVSLTPVLTVLPAPFGWDPADVSAIEWEIAKDPDFSFPVFGTRTEGPEAETINLPDLLLDPGSAYYWRVRYLDSKGVAGDWQVVEYFSTVLSGPGDVNKNGIPDDQEPADAPARIIARHPELEGSDLMVVAAGDTGLRFCVERAQAQGEIVSMAWVDPMDIADPPPVGTDVLYGLVEFRIEGLTIGQDVDVTIYFSRQAPEGFSWWCYDPVNKWRDAADFAVYNQDRTAVTLSLSDGGPLDADGVANGVIVDPGGPAGPHISDQDGACFIFCIMRKH